MVKACYVRYGKFRKSELRIPETCFKISDGSPVLTTVVGKSQDSLRTLPMSAVALDFFLLNGGESSHSRV